MFSSRMSGWYSRSQFWRPPFRGILRLGKPRLKAHTLWNRRRRRQSRQLVPWGRPYLIREEVRWEPRGAIGMEVEDCGSGWQSMLLFIQGGLEVGIERRRDIKVKPLIYSAFVLELCFSYVSVRCTQLFLWVLGPRGSDYTIGQSLCDPQQIHPSK